MHELLTQTLAPLVSFVAHRAWDLTVAAVRRRRAAGLYCTAPLLQVNDRGAAPVGKPGGAR